MKYQLALFAQDQRQDLVEIEMLYCGVRNLRHGEAGDVERVRRDLKIRQIWKAQ